MTGFPVVTPNKFDSTESGFCLQNSMAVWTLLAWVICSEIVCISANPKVAIEKAVQAIKQLKEEFKDNKSVDDEMIKYFSVRHFTNPKAAIEKAIENKNS